MKVAGYLAGGAVLGLVTVKLLQKWATKPAFLTTALSWIGF